MSQILHPSSGKLQFHFWRLLCLLDEGMDDDHAPAKQKAAEGPADAGSTSGPQFEEPIPDGTRMRQPEVRTMFDEQLNQSGVVGEDIDRP
jgi:hypothetical protein